MAKTAKQIMLTALGSISRYIKGFKPDTVDSLRGQLAVIDEIAKCAIEQQDLAEKGIQLWD